MATYAENLAEVERLHGCGSGFVAMVLDPAVDVITVKDPTADSECGPTQVFKDFHGGASEIALSDEPSSTAA